VEGESVTFLSSLPSPRKPGMGLPGTSSAVCGSCCPSSYIWFERADTREGERAEPSKPAEYDNNGLVEALYEFGCSAGGGRRVGRCCCGGLLPRYLCMPDKKAADAFEGASASSMLGPPNVELDVKELGVPFPNPPPNPVRWSGDPAMPGSAHIERTSPIREGAGTDRE